MIRKRFIPLITLFTLLSSCGSSLSLVSESISSGVTSITSETTSSVSAIDPGIIGSITGIQAASAVTGHYFNPLKGVKALSTTGIDITSFIEINGHVDYGTPGSYTLTYKLNYQDDIQSYKRVVTVSDGAYIAPVSTKINNPASVISAGFGSYRTSGASDLSHPNSPTYIEADLLDKPIPTNGWWTTLITENYGGGNGIFLNPLRSSLGVEGVEITNRGQGFVQYWNVGDYSTMAQFSPFYQDLKLKAGTLGATTISKVIDYSDNNVKVTLRNTSSNEDEMVVTYTQGSPYVFSEFKDKNNITLKVDNFGVNQYQYLSLDGTPIADSYTGKAIIIKMIQRHVGYITSLPSIVGGATYEDRYFIVNAPDDTVFTLSTLSHPSGYLDLVTMDLGTGNYVSVAAIKDMTEAAFYHKHGYAFMASSNIDYQVDHINSAVTTTFRNNVQHMEEVSDATGIMALMPHQYKVSDAEPSLYTTRTIRGTLKILEGNSFDTILDFRGVLPSFTTPANPEYSQTELLSHLSHLDAGTNILGSFEDGDKNFIDAPSPYWNAKALYPLSQGLIIADQIGAASFKASFISKLKERLTDWFDYNGTAKDRHLYYNQTWGSMYYSNNDFGTASELSDHHFTHGYLVFASAVLSMYDPTFLAQYGPMISLLLKDYMNYDAEDIFSPFLRSFDAWAGHSWAHGFGTFADGNNQESSGEALNSWVAGYLFGLTTSNEQLVDAAIYGYTSELYSIKQYWFNYDNDNWLEAYSAQASVAGMVWGGKFDYATWFGANPTFIYGIHWLPTGEYLSSYALGSVDKAKLQSIYNKYLNAVGGSPNTWYSNMWAIEALINPTSALANFNSEDIKSDDYPNELVGSYWMVHALQTLSVHSSNAWVEISEDVAGSVYQNDTSEIAMIWNASTTSQFVKIHKANGNVVTFEVAAKSFTSVTL